MRLSLFWHILVAFVAVIVLGIGGMIVFFRLAVEQVSRLERTEVPAAGRSRITRTFETILVNYYVSQNNSWDGVDIFLNDMVPQERPGVPVVVIANANGLVVASTSRRWQVGEMMTAETLWSGVSLRLNNKQIGTLLIWEWGNNDSPFEDRHKDTPPEIIQTLLMGLLAAGAGLALVLFGLAIVSARNLSQPLKAITAATQIMASGKLDVQVPGSRVSELDTLSTAFNTMARALAVADQQRKQMTADIAHELRTPLSVIKGRLEGLQDGVYDATSEQIERLLEDVALLERLINDLRLLALAEAGQIPLYPDLENPRDLLEDTATFFASEADAHGVELLVEAPETLPSVNVDSQRMSQVLNNLVANALRHTPSGGSVTLIGEQRVCNTPNGTSCQVIVRVRDTGQGIAPEDLPHIFDRFWRADPSRTRSSGGSGLGLAIARQIVAAHGGTIEAESELGTGTTMSITLPCATSDERK